MMATFSVVPSPKVSDTVVEPYNATLSVHQLVENSDEVRRECSGSTDAADLLHRQRGAVRHLLPHAQALDADVRRPEPPRLDRHVRHHHLPALPGSAQLGPAQARGQHGSLPASALRPSTPSSPLTPQFMVGFAPLTARRSQQYRAVTVPELTAQMFDAKNMSASGAFASRLMRA